MKVPSAEYNNAVRACAYLGYKLSTSAAASGRTNTREFLDDLLDQCEQLQAKFTAILEAERDANKPVAGEKFGNMRMERRKK